VLALSAAQAQSSPVGGAKVDLFPPNWDRELALQTARFGTDEQQLRDWFALLRNGEAAPLYRSLQNFSTAGVIASPAREKQLFLFTQALSDFPPESIPEEVLGFLERYPSQTLVPHEENAASGVPLFNIAAAAKGVRHSGLREMGRRRAEALNARQPDEWLSAYLAGEVSTRRGFLDHLDEAPRSELESLGATAIAELPGRPDLTAVAGATALRLNDVPALALVVIQGRGAELGEVLRGAARRLPEDERGALLLSIIDHAPAAQASLAIALLAPGLTTNQTITQTLFTLLDRPDLGSAAALALARHPAPEVMTELRRLAGEDGEGARRARMALGLDRAANQPAIDQGGGQ